MEEECELLSSVPGLTGCQGQCEGRRRAGSPPECQQWGRRRSRGRTARTVHPECYAGSSAGRNTSRFGSASASSVWVINTAASCFVPCRCLSLGGTSPSGRCIHRARSGPGINLLRCECIQGHSPETDSVMMLETAGSVLMKHMQPGWPPLESAVWGGMMNYLAGESLVSRWAATLLHFQGLSQAAVVGHSHLHADIRDAGGAHLAGVGRTDEDVIKIGQNHHQVLARRRHAVGPAPVFLQKKKRVDGGRQPRAMCFLTTLPVHVL